MARTPNRSRQTQRLLAAMLEQPLAWRYGYELLKLTGLNRERFIRPCCGFPNRDCWKRSGGKPMIPANRRAMSIA